LYGYKTWSFTLREENRLRVPENSVLRRIFGSKREEVEGARTKLHNEDLHNLYDSPNIIRVITSSRMRRAGHVAHLREMRNTYNIMVGKSERKRPLGRPRRRCEDNIKMGLREIRVGICGLDSSGSGYRPERALMNLRVP
jgi:hypothetical protein